MNLDLFNSQKLQKFTRGQGIRFMIGGFAGVGASVLFLFSVAGDSIFLNVVFGIYAITSVYTIAYGVTVIKKNRRSSGESEPIARTPDL